MSASVDAFLADPWPGLATLALTFLGGYISGRVARSERYASACETFRKSLLSEMAGLYPLPSNWPEHIDAHLRQRFPELQAAVATFRPYVPWYKRWLFDRAWRQYRNAYGRDVDVQVYHHYMAFGSSGDAKESFRRNVSRLLSYADGT